MISVSIDLSKLDESYFFKGKTSNFLNVLLTNTYGKLEVVQAVGKDAYAAEIRGAVVGTWRELGSSKEAGAPRQATFDLARYQRPLTPAARKPTDSPPTPGPTRQPQATSATAACFIARRWSR